MISSFLFMWRAAYGLPFLRSPAESLLQTCEDHIVPYCADPRHTPDTLLFICEEDWRLYRDDADVNETELPRCLLAAELAYSLRD